MTNVARKAPKPPRAPRPSNVQSDLAPIPSRPHSAPAGTQPFQVQWGYALIIAAIHVGSLLAFVPWLFSWTGLALCILGHYVFGMLGITLCYHRLLTHKGFRCPKWLERTLAILGICCLQDTPARWVAIHRRHHQHSDEHPDPHSPLVNFLWGHVGWLLIKNRELHTLDFYQHYARDLLSDPFYFWFERKLLWLWTYVAHAALFFVTGLAIGWISTGRYLGGVQFGLSLLVWGVFVRTVLVWHVTWSVNSLTHLWGYRNYDTDDNSRNNWLVGLLAHGEGWHNNHHAQQRAAAHGHRWWELDLTWLTIRLLERLGLVTEVIRPRPEIAGQSAHS